VTERRRAFISKEMHQIYHLGNFRDHVRITGVRELTKPELRALMKPHRPPEPPHFGEFLFTLLQKPSHAASAIGDLDERFQHDCDRYGVRRAKQMYWAHVLRSAWPLLRRAIGRAVKWCDLRGGQAPVHWLTVVHSDDSLFGACHGMTFCAISSANDRHIRNEMPYMVSSGIRCRRSPPPCCSDSLLCRTDANRHSVSLRRQSSSWLDGGLFFVQFAAYDGGAGRRIQIWKASSLGRLARLLGLAA
jgi:hypothetical protein